MDIIDRLKDIQNRGVELCEAITVGELSNEQIATTFSISLPQARAWRRAAQALFGPCHKAQRSDRDRAAALGRDHKLSIDALVVIDQQVKQLARDVRFPREKLRAELTDAAAGLSVDEILSMARDRLRSLNKNSSVKPVSEVHISKEPDAHGMLRILGRLDPVEFGGFLQWLRKRTKRLYRRNGKLTWAQTQAQALRGFRGHDVPREVGVHVVISADELANGVTRDRVSLTDGHAAELAELVNTRLAPTGWAVVYDPKTHQPAQAFPLERFANDAQNAMLNGHQILCACPDCKIPALEGQTHHIKAFKDGGETNMGNLGRVCAYHHALLTAGKAWISIGENGEFLWHDAATGEVRTNRHPAVAGSGQALISA